MTDMEAIQRRRSRRSYLGTAIAEKSRKRLREAIDQSNQSSGLSIQLIENGRDAFKGFNPSYGMFSGVTAYFAVVGKESDPNLLEKAGYYGERLVLEATRLGLGTCWVGGTYNRSRTACDVKEGEKIVIIITVGNVEEKNSLKENVIYKLAHRGTKTIDQLYSSDTVVPDWFLEGMKAVQRAPSAINLQPVRFNYRNGEVTAEVKGSNSHQLIDLGIAKLHFEIGSGVSPWNL